MARPHLTIYAVDRGALSALEAELREQLEGDDRPGVARTLGLGEALAARLSSRPVVEWFVRADDDAEASPFFASLRRIAKRRALEKVWSSEHPSLEGRLRAYDAVRDDQALAEAIDRALDPDRVPFFLARKGATMGLLLERERTTIVDALGPSGTLRDADLPPELVAFGEELSAHACDLLLHDGLEA